MTDTPEVGVLPSGPKALLPELLKRLLRVYGFMLEAAEETEEEEGAENGRIGKRRVYFFRKRLLIYHGGSLKYELPIERGSRPLNRGAAVLGGYLYYGDYWSNPHRIPAALYQVDLESGERKIIYTFEGVRHIHFVQVDRDKEGCLILGTGDDDEESGIYRLTLPAAYRYQKEEKQPYGDPQREELRLDVLLHGSQNYRAVSIIQTPEALFWGSDAPNGRNYIFRYEKWSGEVSNLREIAGPAYYSTLDAYGRMYIASTIEDRRLHRAVIYRSSDGGESWEEYREFEKDCLPTKYFGHGIVDFTADQQYRREFSCRLFGGLKKSALGGQKATAETPAERFRPIFVLGVGRSGTSLLQSMLNAHRKIAFPPETHYIRNYLAGAKEPGKETGGVGEKRRVGETGGVGSSLSLNPEKRRRILADLYLANLELDLGLLLEESKGPADFYRRVMTQYAEERGKSYVGDKDPKNIEFIKTIAEHFPSALVVHIYRDPRAVVASRLKAEWSKDKPLWQQILAYKAQYRYMLGRAGLFPGRYVSVRYEDLLIRPRKELSKILGKLGIDFEEGMLEFFSTSDEVVKGEERRWKENLYKPVMKGNIDKWRSELSPAQQRRIEGALSKEMREAGYNCENAGAVTKLVYAAAYGIAARLYCALKCR